MISNTSVIHPSPAIIHPRSARSCRSMMRSFAVNASMNTNTVRRVIKHNHVCTVKHFIHPPIPRGGRGRRRKFLCGWFACVTVIPTQEITGYAVQDPCVRVHGEIFLAHNKTGRDRDEAPSAPPPRREAGRMTVWSFRPLHANVGSLGTQYGGDHHVQHLQHLGKDAV